jgi:hypothetical protein
MIADVELHHTTPNFRQLIALRRDGHPGLYRRGTRRGIAPSSLNFDQADPTGSEGLKRIGSTKFRDLDASLKGSTHD